MPSSPFLPAFALSVLRAHAGWFVLVGAVLLAIFSARDHAGSWNDGSRLATVECLVDYHTLAIDRSIFVQVPRPEMGEGPAPYPADLPLLRKYGTCDKLWIGGHYYSDKPPVPALLLAGAYQVWQWCTGLTARDRPDLFCYVLTLASSGLAYVVAVAAVYLLGGALRLPQGPRLLLTGSFALATVALTYARYGNNHVLLLGVASAFFLCAARVAAREQEEAGRRSVRWLVLGMGALAGLGYTIDLGCGPVLFACALALVAYRCRRRGAVALFVLAALPWLATHHYFNYVVGGTFKPANAVPEYLGWPGSPFNSENMTGNWKHGVGSFLVYAAALLFGKRGFIGHNLPLFLALPAVVALLRRRTAELPEVLLGGCWAGGTWLAYALSSNNSSGACCSIRWFVPLLAPGYYVLAIYLRDYPAYRRDFLVLSGWGLALGGLMWVGGPWRLNLVPLFWPIQAAALLSWGYCGYLRRRQVALQLALSGAHHAESAAPGRKAA